MSEDRSISSVDYVMGAVKFDKEILARAAKERETTIIAMSLILISSILGAFVGSTDTAIAEFQDSLDQLDLDIGFSNRQSMFIFLFLSSLVLAFLFVVLYNAILKFMKGTSTVMNTLRIWGLTSVWDILGLLAGLILPPLTSLLGFVRLAAFLVGIASYSGKSEIAAFGAIILLIILLGVFTIVLTIVLLSQGVI